MTLFPPNSFVRGAGGAPIDARYQLAARPVTSLPVNPRDGDRISYIARAAVTGALTDVRYELVYDAKSAYWYPLSPGRLFNYVVGSTFNSLTNVWQNTVTPQIILPLGGDWDCESSALCTQAASGALSPAMGIIANGFGTPGLYAQLTIPASAFGWPETVTAPIPLINRFANDVITEAILTQDATPGNTGWSQRILALTPIRVH